MHKYRIYSDPLPHPALRNGVVRKLIGFVGRAMAIVRLTHLHLTVPSSGSILEPVPGECYPVVPLPRESTISRRVSFAREVAVIESTPFLCSPAGAPDSLTEPATGDPVPRDQGMMQFDQPDYMLFPREEPMDD